MKFKGGKPRPAKPGQKQRKPGRPKGGVFLHKKGGKKAERQRAAAAAAAAAGTGGTAPAQGAGTQAAAGSKPAKPRPGAGAGLGGASGDADDFGYLLDDMPDYRPADEEGGEAGSGGEGGSDAEQPGGSADGEGRPAKRRRKGGQKLSALEFEASRQLARQIADCSAEEQADWLWASYQQQTAASALERGGLTAAGVASLPTEGSLEERLKALQPGSWQQEFCGGGGKGSSKGGKQPGGAAGERPPGSPSLLLVSPSAIGAVNLIKLCPQFNKACKIGKLFAKHFKVAEQEEALRTQVMCLAAGTPNRLCKLADSGALKLDRLKHVVLDVNLDAKQRDILAIPETRADWWQLYKQHLAAPLEAGTLKLSIINSDELRQPGGGS